MATIPVIADDGKSRARFLSSRNMPLNYMADFSIMGFIVDREAEARDLLSINGFRIHKHEVGFEIVIDTPHQLPQISTLFAKNNIRSTFSDIADTLYQA